MAFSGHNKALQERRLNHGLQTLPSGRSAFPVPRNSEFHRSINQKLPELWSDFSDKGLLEARAGHSEQAATFHGDSKLSATAQSSNATTQPPKPGQVVFVGYAEFDMDGRTHTSGEMDRMMVHAAVSKYPCSRPATFGEYADGAILGLPHRNQSGRDIVFIGPGATGCELFHTNSLGSQKCAVSPGDILDGNWGTASLYGRKSILCVYPIERVRRQQSLTQFGLARSTVGKSGRLRRAGSLASITDTTQWVDKARWAASDFGHSPSSTAVAQRTAVRFDASQSDARRTGSRGFAGQ